jgi:beta-1,4-mannosyltransferase
LFFLLARGYDYILIQNPPCMPLLLVTVLIRTFSRTRLIVDWHNYGFSIMQVNGASPRLVRIAKYYETFFGKFADVHLCVSHAFRKELL